MGGITTAPELDEEEEERPEDELLELDDEELLEEVPGGNHLRSWAAVVSAHTSLQVPSWPMGMESPITLAKAAWVL